MEKKSENEKFYSHQDEQTTTTRNECKTHESPSAWRSHPAGSQPPGVTGTAEEVRRWPPGALAGEGASTEAEQRGVGRGASPDSRGLKGVG